MGLRLGSVANVYNIDTIQHGSLAERLNAPVLKTGEDVSPP